MQNDVKNQDLCLKQFFILIIDLYNFRFSENKYSGFNVSQLSFRLLTPLNNIERSFSCFVVLYSSSCILRINIFQFLYSQDQYILVPVFSGSIYSSSCILRINIFQFLYSQDQYILVPVFEDQYILVPLFLGSIYSSSCILEAIYSSS